MSFTISDEVLFATRMTEQEMAMEVAVILYDRGNCRSPGLRSLRGWTWTGSGTCWRVVAFDLKPDQAVSSARRSGSVSVTVPDEIVSATELTEQQLASSSPLSCISERSSPWDMPRGWRG
jgi:hypothetical protein